ncbi:MAG: hypothetical protein ACE5E3_06630, partial [Mariprofundus sp.]
ILMATLFDYIYYAILLGVEMYDGWFYSDLLIATAVGWPVISLLLSLVAKGHRQRDALHAALSQVKELQSILPMCAGCKMIRDEDDVWHHPDEYIRDHTNTRVSHGLCPECTSSIDQDSIKSGH